MFYLTYIWKRAGHGSLVPERGFPFQFVERGFREEKYVSNASRSDVILLGTTVRLPFSDAMIQAARQKNDQGPWVVSICNLGRDRDIGSSHLLQFNFEVWQVQLSASISAAIENCGRTFV